MTAPYRIDVHHHILPPEYVSALAGIGITGGGGVPFPRWSAEEALGLMDRIDGLTQYDGFDASARRAIECDNALSLLPTLRERIEAAGR
jgi:hypothetical protein